MSRTYVIPLGAQHVSLLEPIRFLFTVENERIASVEADIGFVHRGIELACATKFKFKQVPYVVARVCGLCAVVHSTAYVTAVERLMKIETTRRTKWLRIVANELDRIQSHFIALGHTSECAGFEALFMACMKDRETALELTEAFTGNRMQFDYVNIGGVNRDLTPEMALLMKKKLSLLKNRVNDLQELFMSNWSLSLKYKGIGVVSLEDAQRFNATGPIARASGLATDLRVEADMLPYGDVGFELALETAGDIHSRNVVRLRELANSIRMIENILDGLPVGDIEVPVKGNPDGDAISHIEAPRGQCIYMVRGNMTSTLDRVKIQAPTFANIPVIVNAFVGEEYGNAPPILASFDPCLSCTAR
ncbi:MAG TPA: proton-conducting membrane transporter [Bdellovibrionales bacterium]|nr:MAG: NADH dehydrogenase [Bdellovibrionales bacterium GWB1_52_6]OFZ03090.1 MAG: NADH dehydrogenase [Bdellovibrionales bacterium GWA1_52_35]OFZ37697.1 MAG: NADH dehydrogenase [Bdellovibrionales bacterium GWC1_52_8]HAR43010.1 proton-conducting membrane transporter [Bdellovibrionales bacterium]HCM40418.1 proton-conducting membrane transporter [Bdellovibrionales bacterium]